MAVRMTGPDTFQYTEDPQPLPPPAWRAPVFNRPEPLPDRNPIMGAASEWQAAAQGLRDNPGSIPMFFEDNSVGFGSPPSPMGPRLPDMRTGTVNANNPPPLDPLRPNVGPWGGGLKNRVINDYDLTPEAAQLLRDTPTVFMPSYMGEKIVPGAAAWYSPDAEKYPISVSKADLNQGAYPGAEYLAHEFAHKWYDTQLTQPERNSFIYRMGLRGGVGPANNEVRPQMNPEMARVQAEAPNVAQMMNRYIDDPNSLYAGSYGSFGTESFAYLADEMRNGGARYLPSDLRYFYQGLFDVPPAPAPPYVDPAYLGPDANGNWG